MKLFFKRFFFFIITVVLLFSITVPCFASSHGGGTVSDGFDTSDYNDWSFEDKVKYWSYRGSRFIGYLCGLDESVIAGRWYPEFEKKYQTDGCRDFNEYLALQITKDDETNTFVPSNEMIVLLNNFIEEENEAVTMVYRYPITPSQIDGDAFASKSQMDAFLALLDAYPDYYLICQATWNSFIPYETFTIYGTDQVVNGNGLRFYLIDSPTSAVGDYPDLMTSSVTLYDDEWNVCKATKISICIYNDTVYYIPLHDNYDGGSRIGYTLDDFSNAQFTWFLTSPSSYMCLDSSWRRSLETTCFYSGRRQALNCYKTVADMKKDIGSQVIGGYTPDYTGSCGSSFSVDVINNIEIPDSGGGSSGSDDSGGSSGGSGIIDGLGKLFGAIGNIIDKLFGFVLGLLSKVVNFFASILEMFTDTLTKLIDIIPAGFNQFLAAMFPYIPEEWITIAEFILLVSAIGCVVALFK